MDLRTPSAKVILSTTPVPLLVTGGIVTDRKQSDLKPLLQLEVAGIVFEDRRVPFVFFPEQEKLEKLVPSHIAAEPYWSRLQSRFIKKEEDAYEPLIALFQFIIRGEIGEAAAAKRKQAKGKGGGSRKGQRKGNKTQPKKNPATGETAPPTPRVQFRVYLKMISDKADGAGRLKPDALGGDRDDPEYSDKAAVPWRTVWVAIEVKGSWPDALRQGCTYARSMLEAGTRWFALVLVYNQQETSLRFCFATRLGLFVSPAWNLGKPEDFAQAAKALVHVCYAPKTRAGLDFYRELDEAGKLYFTLPRDMGTFKVVKDIFVRRSLCGRSTRVYRVAPGKVPPPRARKGRAKALEDDDTPAPPAPVRDPPSLNHNLSVLGDAGPLHRSGQLLHVDAHMLRSSARTRTTKATGTVAATGAAAPATPPSPTPRVISSSGVHIGRVDDAEPEDDSSEVASEDSIGPLSDAKQSIAEWAAIVSGKKAVFEWAADKPAASYKSFVIRETWAPLSRMNTEFELLRDVGKECYGIVKYLGHVVLPHMGLERLSLFSDANNHEGSWKCTDWPQVYLSGEEPEFNPRVHHVVCYDTDGTNLTEIGDDPWSVAHSLKDVITTLYILFTKDWLHRDLALGNVIPLLEWVENTEEVIEGISRAFGQDPRFEALRGMYSYQRSVLCDFDQAVKWTELREHLRSRSGTPAFMAAARSTAWVLELDWLDTLFDDLEAGTWAHFYAVLRRVIEQFRTKAEAAQGGENDEVDDEDDEGWEDEADENVNGATAGDATALEASFAELEARHFETFNGDDGYYLTAVKEWILKYGSSDKAIGARVLKATWPLWRRMFGVANTARAVADDLKAKLAKERAQYFGQASEGLQKELRAACKDVTFLYLEAINETLNSDFARYDPFKNTDQSSGDSFDDDAPNDDDDDDDPFV